MDNEVEAVIDRTDVVTPNFSEEEIGSILESVASTELIESLKSVISPSVEEVNEKVSMKLLSEVADSESVKPDEGEVIDRGSFAGGPDLILGYLKRAERLRRYAHLRSRFLNDTGD